MSAFEDLEIVVTTDTVEIDDVWTAKPLTIPAGTRGTVVAVYADGEAYEIEFTGEIEALGTIRSASLTKG